MISAWLDPGTATKYKFVSLEEIFRDYIDESKVPVAIGGKANVLEYTMENIDDGTYTELWDF